MLNTIKKANTQTFNIPNRIDSLQAARLFSALFVSLFHFTIIWEKLDPTIINVGFWVRFFFAVSGFIIMLSTQNPAKKKWFFTRRLIRLVPLYWILTLCTFAAAQFVPDILGYRPTVDQLVKSMFFIPYSRSALKSDSVLRPLVGLGHTLQIEVLFSLIFMLCMRFSHKFRGLIASAVLVVLLLLGLTFDFANPFMQFYINSNTTSWGAFIVGILCYYLLSLLAKKQTPVKKTPCLIIPALITILLLSVSQLFYFQLPSAIAFSIQYIAFFFILVFIIMYSFWKLPTLPFFIKLGSASFSYYLIHYFLVSISEKVFKINAFSAVNIILIVLTLIAAWICSYISWYFIENLLGKYLTSKLK